MQVQVAPVGGAEQPQQVDGVGLEDLRRVDVEPPALLVEAGVQQGLAGLAPARQQAGDALGLLLDPLGLQLGGEDAGERADLLGDQEVAPHETFDGRRVAPVAIAHAPGDLRLQVEGQALLGAARGEVQMAAHRPQEVEGAQEGRHLLALEHLQVDDAVGAGLGRGVQVLGDPEQGVEVAQGALALLDVGLHQVAAGAGPGVALVALLQLGGDELGARPLHHLGGEPPRQLLGQLLIAGQPPGLQDRGADREVFLGQPDAFLDRARGVADLEAQVPQRIEHVLDDALGVGRLLVGPQEQQIEVGEGRQRAAPVAADGHQGQALPLGGIARPEHVDRGEVIEGGDDFVRHTRQQPGGLDAAGAVLQTLLGDHPAPEQGLLEDIQGAAALLGLVAGGVQGRRRELGAQADAVDDIFQARGTQAWRHGKPKENRSPSYRAAPLRARSPQVGAGKEKGRRPGAPAFGSSS